MSWMNIFGGSSSNVAKPNIPATTALQQQRLKQIDTLKSIFHSVTEVQRDVEYRVTFSVGTSTMFLNVNLPPQFPNEKPIVKVSPPVHHPWVSDQMVVTGCPALNMFYMHSSLGKAVQDVVREFSEHPPQLITQPTTGSQPSMPSSGIVGGYQPSSTYSFSGYQPQVTPFSSTGYGGVPNTNHMFPMTSTSGVTPVSSTQRNSPNSDEVPTCTSQEFPELNGLSLIELKELNDNKELLEEFVKSKLEPVKKLQVKKEDITKENELIARNNLSLQPKFEALKHSILTNHELQSSLTTEFAQRSQKQKYLSEIYSISSIHTNMELAAAEADQDSEAIADSFLNGEIKTDEFIQTYMEKRKLCHLRRAKEEKMRYLHTHF
ncbi:vacuolar protein sorting-associated protein 37A-like [Actinia tenebrosa]|uniref:Vacuolar protein sorting-associated protein 37A-like n=1 Tax=Actinia tenebrosa TaxID=6105 RepID=A0A6P8J5D5_ACTTE|nr:vacuolar protein sorting-associated protein 37A-like [Actinia tenebrosa]